MPLIQLSSLVDSALYYGVMHHSEVSQCLVDKSLYARLGFLKGVNPVELLMLEFIANSVNGILSTKSV